MDGPYRVNVTLPSPSKDAGSPCLKFAISASISAIWSARFAFSLCIFCALHKHTIILFISKMVTRLRLFLCWVFNLSQREENFNIFSEQLLFNFFNFPWSRLFSFSSAGSFGRRRTVSISPLNLSRSSSKLHWSLLILEYGLQAGAPEEASQ